MAINRSLCGVDCYDNRFCHYDCGNKHFQQKYHGVIDANGQEAG